METASRVNVRRVVATSWTLSFHQSVTGVSNRRKVYPLSSLDASPPVTSPDGKQGAGRFNLDVIPPWRRKKAHFYWKGNHPERRNAAKRLWSFKVGMFMRTASSSVIALFNSKIIICYFTTALMIKRVCFSWQIHIFGRWFFFTSVAVWPTSQY